MLLSKLRRAWLSDEPAMVRAGYAGERALARARLILFSALLLIPLSWAFTRDMERWELAVGLVEATAAVLIAAGVFWVARRPRLPRWFGMVSGVLDITLVSAALAAFFLVDQPLTAVNSTVIFEFYFLGLAATALRYDWRVCILAGLAAVLEYLGIAWIAAANWDLSDALWEGSGYGHFRWSTVLGRTVVLGVAAALAAVLVARAGRLRTASVRDRLTGVANRAYFDERLAEELGRSRRTGAPLAVALLDIDHFKRLNDRHGHIAGDVVLRTVAEALRRHVRGHDVLARYGGEEFGILLVDTPPEVAMARLETLRKAVAALRVRVPHLAERLAVTASCGVASADEPGDGDDLAVLHLADERLYRAKAAGRNRVVGPGTPGAPAATEWEGLPAAGR